MKLLTLLFSRCSNRTNIGACAAFSAFARVDDVFIGTLANGVHRAFRLASAATDAFITNLVTHKAPPNEISWVNMFLTNILPLAIFSTKIRKILLLCFYF